MSAPIDHAVFQTSDGDLLIYTANLWRGAMIDRFAQIEFFIDRTFAACVQARLVPPEDAHAPLPRARCKLLLSVLDEAKVAGIGESTRASLQLVYERWDERNMLCHGRMKAGKSSVAFRWTRHDKRGGGPQCRRIHLIEMLDLLETLDELKKVVGSQLGSVAKLCRPAA